MKHNQRYVAAAVLGEDLADMEEYQPGQHGPVKVWCYGDASVIALPEGQPIPAKLVTKFTGFVPGDEWRAIETLWGWTVYQSGRY